MPRPAAYCHAPARLPRAGGLAPCHRHSYCRCAARDAALRWHAGWRAEQPRHAGAVAQLPPGVVPRAGTADTQAPQPRAGIAGTVRIRWARPTRVTRGRRAPAWATTTPVGTGSRRAQAPRSRWVRPGPRAGAHRREPPLPRWARARAVRRHRGAGGYDQGDRKSVV